MISVEAELDAPGTVGNGTANTHTLTPTSGSYYEWYGTLFSGRAAATADQSVQVRCEFGTTPSATVIAQENLTVPVTPEGKVWSVWLAPPSGMYVQGGEDVVLDIIVDNTASGSGSLSGVRSSTYYLERKTVKGSG
jgi:hypothetical protein